MDVLPYIYYAVICASLAWASPLLRTTPMRIAAGVLVGAAASAVLPFVRVLLG